MFLYLPVASWGVRWNIITSLLSFSFSGSSLTLLSLSPLLCLITPLICALCLQVDISIPALPALRPSDDLQCVFGSFFTGAVKHGGQVTCSLPDPVEIPATPDQQGMWTDEGCTDSLFSVYGLWIGLDWIGVDCHSITHHKNTYKHKLESTIMLIS